MKTVEEFYKEMAGSQELQEELQNAYDEMLKAFLTKYGCEADAKAFLKCAEGSSEGELEDDDAAAIAGGWGGAVCRLPGREPTVVPLI